MADVHPSSVVSGGADLADDVVVGPFCVVEDGVRLGAGCRLISHCHVAGPATFGEGNVFYPSSVVGLDTTDKKHRGGDSGLIVGDNNRFREACTIHRATESGDFTRIGNGNLFMPCSHVGHDSVVEDDCILVNFSGVAGHVHIATGAILSASVTVHQGCYIGTYAFLAMGVRLLSSVPAWSMVSGHPGRYVGGNVVGMRRLGKTSQQRRWVHQAHKIIFRQAVDMASRVEELRQLSATCGEADVAEVLRSIEMALATDRGLIR